MVVYKVRVYDIILPCNLRKNEGVKTNGHFKKLQIINTRLKRVVSSSILSNDTTLLFAFLKAFF